MLRRARQSVYWPGIDAEVEQKRRQCAVCDTHALSSPAETLLPTPPPQYPFQQVVADLFQLDGHTYIAVAGRLSGWLEVEHLSGDATSARLITVFRRWFKRFGIPEELSCDGGTNLTSQESRGFLDTWRVRLRGSEASPAQLVTGRQLRDAIPVDASLYEVSERWAWLLRERERAMARSGDSAASRHDQTAHNLEPLTPGLRTRILNPGSGRWDRAGIVLETTAPRQYLVRLDGSGRTTIRNRRHLRPLTCVQAHDDGTTAMPDATPPSQPSKHKDGGPPEALRMSYRWPDGSTTISHRESHPTPIPTPVLTPARHRESTSTPTPTPSFPTCPPRPVPLFHYLQEAVADPRAAGKGGCSPPYTPRLTHARRQLQALLAVPFPTSPITPSPSRRGLGGKANRGETPGRLSRWTSSPLKTPPNLNPPTPGRSIPVLLVTEANRGGTPGRLSCWAPSPQGTPTCTKPPTPGRSLPVQLVPEEDLGVWCLAAAKGQ
ncbi:hypothetical protein GWK47_042256 [Chionoecetes opilio]|uniref:Integrase catalytic domain-containing protein n=1 Tax=Chionoecetes opilio TaxID=41210 RepID=A0A8J5CWS5_CHIOP|nr:hypothetical protein GWK47_042256 [Chionoecetes opilio]